MTEQKINIEAMVEKLSSIIKGSLKEFIDKPLDPEAVKGRIFETLESIMPKPEPSPAWEAYSQLFAIVWLGDIPEDLNVRKLLGDIPSGMFEEFYEFVIRPAWQAGASGFDVKCFILEQQRRKGDILDWNFERQDARNGIISFSPKQPVDYIKLTLKEE